MLLLRAEKLPQGIDWAYEIKLDGYRAIALKTGGKVQLRSRNDNDFSGQYPSIIEALRAMPDNTVLDGEVVALDAKGKPSFNLLQNYGSSKGPLVFFLFDVLILSGRDVMSETLDRRRTLLEQQILPKLKEPIRFSPQLNASLTDLIASVKDQRFEGLVAKKRTSHYEPGLRSGAWQKMRVNLGQEFVIGGYTFGGKTFDALVFGYYDAGKLIYAARTRNGFTPATRAGLMNRFKDLESDLCLSQICPSPEAADGARA
jgi:ATP-dependent DNA ligase